MFDGFLNGPLDVVTTKRPVEKSAGSGYERERTGKFDRESQG